MRQLLLWPALAGKNASTKRDSRGCTWICMFAIILSSEPKLSTTNSEEAWECALARCFQDAKAAKDES